MTILVGESFPHIDPEMPVDWPDRLAEDFPEISDAIAPTEELLASSIERVRSDPYYRSRNHYLKQIDLYNASSGDYSPHPYNREILDNEKVYGSRIHATFASPDTQRKFELFQAFQLAKSELSGDDSEYREDPLMPLKMLMTLRLIRPEPGKELSGFTSVPSISQVVNDLDAAAKSLDDTDRASLHKRTKTLISGLVEYAKTAEQPYLKNASRLLRGFGNVHRSRGPNSFLVSSFQDIPDVSATVLRRVELYGEDSIAADEIIDGVERIKASPNFSTLNFKKWESRSLEMILGTIRVLGRDMGSENARKMYELLIKNKTKARLDSNAAEITLGSFIQLANGLVGSINSSKRNDEPRMEMLDPVIQNLPEAFRRIMYVALDGDEADPRADQLELNKRFEAVDVIAETIDNRSARKRKLGKVAVSNPSRGELPNKGQLYWRRWRTGYGRLS